MNRRVPAADVARFHRESRAVITIADRAATTVDQQQKLRDLRLYALVNRHPYGVAFTLASVRLQAWVITHYPEGNHEVVRLAGEVAEETRVPAPAAGEAAALGDGWQAVLAGRLRHLAPRQSPLQRLARDVVHDKTVREKALVVIEPMVQSFAAAMTHQPADPERQQATLAAAIGPATPRSATSAAAFAAPVGTPRAASAGAAAPRQRRSSMLQQPVEVSR